MTNDQVAHSNKTIALLKTDIENLRKACHGERKTHVELIHILDDESQPVASKQTAHDNKVSDHRQNNTIVYYKVIVEGCNWSVGK